MLVGVFGDAPLGRIVKQIDQRLFDGNHDAAAALPPVELAADGQHGVADFLGGQAAGRAAPQQAVGGVLFHAEVFHCRVFRGLAVGVAEQNLTVQRFDFPAACYQLARQIVEQLRVAGALAHESEVVGRVDDSPVEIAEPDAVDHDPGSQRVAGVGDPIGQFRAGIFDVLRKRRRVFRQQDPQRARVDRLQRLGVVASVENVNRLRIFGIVAHGRQRRRRFGQLRFERVVLGLQLDALGAFRRLDPGAQLFHLAGDFLGFLSPCLNGQTACEHEVGFVGGAEVGLQAVVIDLSNGVEHVVVAAGAADGHGQERGADDVGALGENFVAAGGDFLVAGVAADRSQAVKAGGGQRFAAAFVLGIAAAISSPASCSRMNRS